MCAYRLPSRKLQISLLQGKLALIVPVRSIANERLLVSIIEIRMNITRNKRHFPNHVLFIVHYINVQKRDCFHVIFS